jgi:lipopolysaccharide assembly protein B
MTEYIAVFAILLVALVGLYAAYDRYFVRRRRQDSAIYVEALKDLLDGRLESAFSKLRQAVAEDSTNLDAYLRLGRILRDHNKPDRALQVHKDLTLRRGLDPKQKAAVLRELAMDYRELKDHDMAEAALREYLQYLPESRWGYVQLLKVLESAQKWEDAYDTAARLLKLEHNKSKKPLAQYKVRVGEKLRKTKQYHKARIHFKEALSLDPACVDAYLQIGDSYFEEKRYEDSAGFWLKLIEAVPAQGHRALGRLQTVLYDLGRFGEIEQICQQILEHDPRNYLARLYLARFHLKKGETDIARDVLTQVVEDCPDQMEAVIELVRIHVEQNDHKRLDELFRMLEHKHETRRATAADSLKDTSLIGIG